MKGRRQRFISSDLFSLAVARFGVRKRFEANDVKSISNVWLQAVENLVLVVWRETIHCSDHWEHGGEKEKYNA
jgi:hypothetical protein